MNSAFYGDFEKKQVKTRIKSIRLVYNPMGQYSRQFAILHPIWGLCTEVIREVLQYHRKSVLPAPRIRRSGTLNSSRLMDLVRVQKRR